MPKCLRRMYMLFRCHFLTGTARFRERNGNRLLAGCYLGMLAGTTFQRAMFEFRHHLVNLVALRPWIARLLGRSAIMRFGMLRRHQGMRAMTAAQHLGDLRLGRRMMAFLIMMMLVHYLILVSRISFLTPLA